MASAPVASRAHHTARPLCVYNAGSSTALGQVRAFLHRAGRLVMPPVWMTSAALPARPLAPLTAAPAL